MDEQLVPAVGALAPEFALADGDGNEVSLSAQRAAGHVVLYFLRAFT